jgi:LuxR family transcriptional regulator (chaperone HchA-associated)
MSEAALGRVVTTIAAIERSADMSTLRHAVRAFAGPLGYDRFVLYAAPPPGDGIVERLLWLEGDWFGGGDEVDPETYLARCPVNRHVLETDHPFFWTKTRRAGHETYRIVRQPHGPGIHGLQVPVFGHVGLVGAASFGGMSIDSSTDARLALTLVATAASRTALSLSNSNTSASTARLSARELEVIRWVASGRRQSDIATLLGLSERTIENHLRRVRKRLGAASTAQAVHILVRVGELEP